MALTNFYRGKTALVSGHTGFKGTWLTAWLEALGAEVVGFSLPPDGGGAPAGARHSYGDVGDYPALLSAFERHRPDVVFHLAAQALVRRSYRDPVATYATNVMGTVHVLEAARHTPSVRAVVNVTSDKCYENGEWLWGYREQDPLGGHDPYSSSKGCAELVTAAYRRSFAAERPDLAIASARAGNVIGGGDWAEDRIVPDLVRALRAGRPVVLRRPASVRPWQHVLEPLRGYLLLGERLGTEGRAFAEAWNFGPPEARPVTVLELARRFVQIWGDGEIRVEEDPAAPHEAGYLRLDCSKAHQRLGWWPRLAIDDALRWTAEWYRAYRDDPAAAQALTRRQIRAYSTLLEDSEPPGD